MASNLKRSKRTVGKRINDINRRVTRLQKKSAPTSIAPGTVTNVALSTPVSTSIAAAQATADGKNAIYYQNDAPGEPLTVGDLWFDSNNDYALSKWNGTAWESFGLGNAAFSNIDAGKITAGTISVTGVGGVNAINGGTPTGGLYPFSVSSSGVLRAVSGTVGGFSITGTTISATFLDDFGVGGSDSGSLTLETDGTIVSNYTNVRIGSNFYTNVTINDYSATGQGSITVSGTASGILSTTYYRSIGQHIISDLRLKNVLSNAVDALSVLKEIDVVKFSYSNDALSKEHVGFIAQQLRSVVPEAVVEGGDDPESAPWTVSRDYVVPHLVRAAQQLSEKITALETRLSALESEK